LLKNNLLKEKKEQRGGHEAKTPWKKEKIQKAK
jgi:hypothetical protein